MGFWRVAGDGEDDQEDGEGEVLFCWSAQTSACRPDRAFAK
jgi:hypothetical protein